MHKWANVYTFLKYNSKTDVLCLNFCRIFKKIGHKYSKGRCEGKMGRSRGLEIGLLSSVRYLLCIKRVERESFESLEYCCIFCSLDDVGEESRIHPS